MNDKERHTIIHKYLSEVKAKFRTGQAKEHAYRPAFATLMESFPGIHAINDPKRSEHGAPDFVFQKKSGSRIIQGYAETKDLDGDLDKVEKTDQMIRYRGYSNLILTNYLEFRFFRNGEKYRTISIGELKDNKLETTAGQGDILMRELEAFLSQAPESISSGLRLAQIMGGRARRLRDNIIEYLKRDSEKNRELLRIYEMMKELLVHDLEPDKFADMYAQTLVYGLFVARYNNSTAKTFTRNEARDLVPKSNPFLLQFFDHIVGPNFDTRLAYIVDDLCEIFSVSNVQEIVHEHLRINDDSTDEKDPIIHFYEDFLQAYDPQERKRMGAYYTPVPVVRYIIRQVDRILKEDFGITNGLASDEMTTMTRTVQPYRKRGEHTDRTTEEITVPKVQILDPAVGTATFLNETIKFIYQSFKGQEGRWPSYVNQNLLNRLYGFELMMAPYTIAHLKLGMTLKETGVEDLKERLGIYLTNTLENIVPVQMGLFNFGLAEAVSEESRLAAQVKRERPVMVIIGNPPYSVSSDNNSPFIRDLVSDYKKNLNERNIQPLSDDYIKFIRFAENMIEKNGEGIIAMITNHSYIDGVIHRQMRKHLLETFNKIYILDLHGNANRKEVAPDGSKDENVFDIKQGVSIVFLIKNSLASQKCEVHHSEIFGLREHKFATLEANNVCYKPIVAGDPFFFYVDKKFNNSDAYSQNISIGELFHVHNAGVATGNDRTLVAFNPEELISNIGINYIDDIPIIPYFYRPFDLRYTVYDNNRIQRLRTNVMKHAITKDNPSLLTTQLNRQISTLYVGIAEGVSDRHYLDSAADSMHVFPLYLFHKDGSSTPNFNQAVYNQMNQNLDEEPSPETLLDYIYAVLHSPSYRDKYKAFLKIDFPRVPIPTQDEFDRLVPLGRQLRELHLMQTPIIDGFRTTFPVNGDCIVEKIKYAYETVWINNNQFFGNVPELAWNFYIGGYQPAQKWLKDRKGRQLSDQDLVHYQRIIKILLETDRLMEEIG